jgi:hypothetical protein
MLVPRENLLPVIRFPYPPVFLSQEEKWLPGSCMLLHAGVRW